MKKPILCLDFDGVCHSYTSGWQGAEVIPDPPVPGLFKFLRKAIKKFDVHIFSSRTNQPGGLGAMQDWFIDHGWEGTYLTGPEYLHFPTERPPAHVTLDDRAITFVGVWPDVDELLAFKPWNA